MAIDVPGSQPARLGHPMSREALVSSRTPSSDISTFMRLEDLV
jgi:hypothetical protein